MKKKIRYRTHLYFRKGSREIARCCPQNSKGPIKRKGLERQKKTLPNEEETVKPA